MQILGVLLKDGKEPFVDIVKSGTLNPFRETGLPGRS